MQPQLFGVNSHGVFSVDKDNGQVCGYHIIIILQASCIIPNVSRGGAELGKIWLAYETDHKINVE